MRLNIPLALLSWLVLSHLSFAQVDAYYTPGEPSSDDYAEVLFNSVNVNGMMGFTDIQYSNAKLLPPDPGIHWMISAYLPAYKPMSQVAIGFEGGLYTSLSFRLRNQYHFSTPLLARVHYGAGAYSDARKWFGFGAGFGVDPHWTFQAQERVGQTNPLTGMLEFTFYQSESTGFSMRYHTSLLSSYFHKQTFSINFFIYTPF